MPPSSSLTGLRRAAFDPATGQGYVTIGADIPGYPTQQIDPNDSMYGLALQDAANHRNVGTPNYLGGVGGLTANRFQGLDEALNALSTTTGKTYGFGRPKPGAGVMGTS